MLLTVHVKPNARKTEIKRWFDKKTVKVNINATPENGKANAELVTFFSKILNVPKSDIRLVRGKTGRMKQIAVPDTCYARIEHLQSVDFQSQ